MHIIRFSASDFPAESILLLSLDAYTFFPEPSGFATLTNLIFNAYEGNSGSLAVEVYPYERNIEYVRAISFPQYSVVSLGVTP